MGAQHWAVVLGCQAVLAYYSSCSALACTPLVGTLVYLLFTNAELIGLFLQTLPRDVQALGVLIRMKRLIGRRMAANKPITHIFDTEIVAGREERMALSDVEDGTTYTFKQMQRTSRRVANYFKDEQLRKGDVCALFCANCADFPVLWLGLARLGVVTAWINFNQRINVLGHSVSSAKATCIVVTADLQEALVEAIAEGHVDGALPVYVWANGETTGTLHPKLKAKLLKPLVAAASDADVVADVTFRDVLCYIYTSGTTGMPKAAVIKHYRFYWMSQGVRAAFGITEDDRLYITMPMYHSAAGILGIGQVITGGCSACIRRKFSASRFWDDCIKYKATATQYIGEVCRYLLAQPEKPQEKQHSVRVMYGNGLRPQIWRDVVNRFGIERIGEFYGSTEGNSNIVNTDNHEGAVGFFPIAYKLFARAFPVSLIKVDETTGEIVRDAQGMCVLCQRGESGQMVGRIVRGDALLEFSGYANNKEGTDKKVIRDVLEKGDIAFSSGDILYMDKLGYLYFKDRTGDTFRWKGENVSTTEVESAVHNALDLTDATVYGVQIPGQEGRAGMAAIVDAEHAIDDAFLDKFLLRIKATLPPYARPVFLRLCQEVDKTGTFKLRKTDLQKAAFDPAKCRADDRLYYMNAKTQKYERLTADVHDQILKEAVKF